MSSKHERDQAPDEFDSGITHIDLSAVARLFSEVYEEIAPQGTRVKLADIVDSQIIIHSVRPFMGRFGQAAFVLFTSPEGELFNTVISNKVILPKLYAVRDQLPLVATVVKKGEEGANAYYDLE